MFELNKSIGLIVNGVHTIYKKGETFVIGVDDKIITLLHKSGADIQEVVEEVEVKMGRKPKAEKAE